MSERHRRKRCETCSVTLSLFVVKHHQHSPSETERSVSPMLRLSHPHPPPLGRRRRRRLVLTASSFHEPALFCGPCPLSCLITDGYTVRAFLSLVRVPEYVKEKNKERPPGKKRGRSREDFVKRFTSAPSLLYLSVLSETERTADLIFLHPGSARLSHTSGGIFLQQVRDPSILYGRWRWILHYSIATIAPFSSFLCGGGLEEGIVIHSFMSVYGNFLSCIKRQADPAGASRVIR